jgi:Endonuclease NucS C-terminal domain
MQRIGLWQILGTSLARVAPMNIDLEESLETWIANDPSLIQADLVIIARQLTTEAGRLDLLGIDPQGRWTVIIEIKRGTVSRDTIAQGLDYASVIGTASEDQMRALLADQLAARKLSLDTLLKERDAIDSLDPAEREVALIVVGTGRSPGLERMSSFLTSRSTVPLSIICFDAFKLNDGGVVLAREVAETPKEKQTTERQPAIPPSAVVELARSSENWTGIRADLSGRDESRAIPENMENKHHVHLSREPGHNAFYRMGAAGTWPIKNVAQC